MSMVLNIHLPEQAIDIIVMYELHDELQYFKYVYQILIHLQCKICDRFCRRPIGMRFLFRVRKVKLKFESSHSDQSRLYKSILIN